MILIYTQQTSTRLQYTCKFIFEEMLGTAFSLTLHAESFAAHDGPKINYSNTKFDKALNLGAHALLFEAGISKQQVNCFQVDDQKAFFKTENADYPFDIFAATFYLISRYEEYLPHQKDMYGRYAHENSVAFKEDFLNIPLVNIWLKNFHLFLNTFFDSAGNNSNADELSTFSLQPLTFKFIPTYDIDMAWSHKEKGFVRNLAGFIRRPSLSRIASLIGIKKDPFDSYRFLDGLHTRHKSKPLYFFLVAKRNGVYDKNILPNNEAMQQLIQTHADKYEIGLHPSWQSNEEPAHLKEEKKLLETITNKPVNISRQHYIKFSLPETFHRLIAAGITDDYSMGYGSINGFRASAATSHSWYDLKNEKITALRLHPFCFMDANCFYEQKLSIEESYAELMHYYLACKEVNGTLISIFHNNFLGTDRTFAGWRDLYNKFISQLP